MLTRGRATALVVAALALGVAAAAPQVAWSDYDHTVYSYDRDADPNSSGGCDGRVDPVTLVLYGYTAYYSQARSVLQSRMGWGGDNDASQWGSSHGFCTRMDGESFSACDICNRDHVRLNQTHHKDDKGRYETVGTPHHDTVTYCGHVADTFNGTRNAIRDRMINWYEQSWQYWGNTQSMRQCDGRYTAGDGWAVWLNIG